MNKIPLIDLKAQYRALKGQIDRAIKRVLEEQAFILGKEVETLERKIASYCGVKYAVGVNSGTDALILALEASGIKAKDEVITTPFTFVATAEAIVRLGAKPVFIDIEPDTYNINPDLIEKKVTKRTKAILPVHLFGLCVDMDPILKVARKYDLKVVEDCAQAIGAEYKGRKAGGLADAAALSFFPSKNLGGFGDGGMVMTNNKKIYDRIKLLRNHGSLKKYYHKVIGYNSRLDNLQAAILNIKLKYLDKWLAKRMEIAEYYNKKLRNYPVITPSATSFSTHTYHLYVLKTVKRNVEGLSRHLERNGVESRSYYPVPLHLQRCFKYLGYKRRDFPDSEMVSVSTLAIPIYPELKDAEKEYVSSKIKEFFLNHDNRKYEKVRAVAGVL